LLGDDAANDTSSESGLTAEPGDSFPPAGANMVDDVNDVNAVDVFDGRRDLEDRMFPPEQNNDPYADSGDEQKQDYLPSNTAKMNQTTQEMLVSNLGSNVDRLDQVYEAETDQDIFDAYKEQFQAFLGQYLQFLEAESDDLRGQKDSTSFASRLRLVPASVRDALAGAALSAAVITRKPNWYHSVKNVFVGDVRKAEAELASIVMSKSGETDDDIRSLGAFYMDVRRKAALTHVSLADADDLNVASKRYDMWMQGRFAGYFQNLSAAWMAWGRKKRVAATVEYFMWAVFNKIVLRLKEALSWKGDHDVVDYVSKSVIAELKDTMSALTADTTTRQNSKQWSRAFAIGSLAGVVLSSFMFLAAAPIGIAGLGTVTAVEGAFMTFLKTPTGSLAARGLMTSATPQVTSSWSMDNEALEVFAVGETILEGVQRVFNSVHRSRMFMEMIKDESGTIHAAISIRNRAAFRQLPWLNGGSNTVDRKPDIFVYIGVVSCAAATALVPIAGGVCGVAAAT
jgi:hypothetical protein